MLAGDVVVGRFVPLALRDRLVLPLCVLLGVPFLLFPFTPPVPVAAALVALSAFGCAALLPLQERLVGQTSEDTRGQAFGLFSTGLMVAQGLGAALAGGIAQLLPGVDAVGWAMASMAVMSLLVTALLLKGVQRSTDLAAHV
jgi:predicted MFS family arabinose efflux permease